MEKPTPDRDPDLPDGAKPGTAAPATESDKHSYDADAKAKAREEATIRIGGRTFRRVKKSWDVTRELRKLFRTQDRESGRIARLIARKAALVEQIRGVRDSDTGDWASPPLTDEDEIKQIEQQIDRFDDEIDQANEKIEQAGFDMIQLLLRETGENGEKPTDEFLKESLDENEAGELVNVLTSGDEPDPTPATPST